MAAEIFNPALIVVDFQEDFCPPNGSLAVPLGRSISPIVNALLALPFLFKVATRDWHPPNHISFAANHQTPCYHPQPFVDNTTVVHPDDPSRSYSTTLWPVHCVAGSPGAQLVPELDVANLDLVLDKGKDPRVEMYSAFYDPFHVEDSGLAGMLRERDVTHVYVVGLAADYCVRATAIHAFEEGYNTFIVDEGTKPVSPDNWPQVREEILSTGVKIVPFDSDEVGQVKERA